MPMKTARFLQAILSTSRREDQINAKYGVSDYWRTSGDAGGKLGAAGVETCTQQRRTEESGPGGVFLSRAESSGADAQRRWLPAGGRQDDVSRAGGRFRLFDGYSAEISRHAHHGGEAQHRRIRVGARAIRLRLYRRRQVSRDGRGQQRRTQRIVADRRRSATCCPTEVGGGRSKLQTLRRQKV